MTYDVKTVLLSVEEINLIRGILEDLSTRDATMRYEEDAAERALSVQGAYIAEDILRNLETLSRGDHYDGSEYWYEYSMDYEPSVFDDGAKQANRQTQLSFNI